MVLVLTVPSMMGSIRLDKVHGQLGKVGTIDVLGWYSTGLWSTVMLY